nr:hypothetical protein [Alcaligenes faecalis]
MDYSLISSAVSAINGAIDIGKAVVTLRDDSKATEIVRAMNEKLLDAQQRLFELSAALNTLQHENFQAAQELRELKETLAERGSYSLVDLGNSNFAYRKNLVPQESGATEPGLAESVHYLCQSCFDGPSKRKVVLMPNRMGWPRCSVCNTEMRCRLPAV